jgi:chlorinating enzyme
MEFRRDGHAGAIMGKALSDAQIRQFHDQGFVFPLSCLRPGEARQYRDRFETYERTIGESAHRRLRIKAHLAFPWLVELARHPRILDAVEDILGPDLLVYLSSLWFKNARDPSFVSWHQDSAYYGLEPHDEITAWVAFTDSTVENGCVRVLPGTHRGPDHRHVETYDPNNLLSRGQSIAGLDDRHAVDMVLRAGEFSIHHERLVHGSNTNVTADRRLGMSFIYIPTRVRSVVGRRPALLVRGRDTYGHWDPDPVPRFDLDPICLEHMERCIGGYTDRAVRQEAARGN